MTPKSTAITTAIEMNSITLILPYGVSANRYWRTYMPKGFKAPVTVVSPEAKAYKLEVARIAKLAGVLSPIKGRVAISYVLYPQRPLDYKKRIAADPFSWDDSVRCHDLDNQQKCLFDALKGIVFEDDKWIRKIEANRVEPDGEARVVVTVTGISIDSPQTAMFGEVA